MSAHISHLPLKGGDGDGWDFLTSPPPLPPIDRFSDGWLDIDAQIPVSERRRRKPLTLTPVLTGKTRSQKNNNQHHDDRCSLSRKRRRLAMPVRPHLIARLRDKGLINRTLRLATDGVPARGGREVRQ